mmetsp:Transcript_2283/g.8160  ORF Transcript_2283/g.8160 Transcript_2283/m.8160 type:complete len:901 (+) Transcript_2283:175-2877(+)
MYGVQPPAVEHLLLFALDNGECSRNEDVRGVPGLSRLQVQFQIVRLLAVGNYGEDPQSGSQPSSVRQRVGLLTMAERSKTARKSQSRVVLAPVDADTWPRELASLENLVGEAGPSSKSCICATLKTALLLMRRFPECVKKRLVVLCCSDVVEERKPLEDAAAKLSLAGVELDIVHFGHVAHSSTCGILKAMNLLANSGAGALAHQQQAALTKSGSCIVEQPLLSEQRSSTNGFTETKMIERSSVDSASGSVCQAARIETDTMQKDACAALEFCLEMPINVGSRSILQRVAESALIRVSTDVLVSNWRQAYLTDEPMFLREQVGTDGESHSGSRTARFDWGTGRVGLMPSSCVARGDGDFPLSSTAEPAVSIGDGMANPHALPENANCRLDVALGTEFHYQVALIDPTNNTVQQAVSIGQFGKLIRLFVEPLISVRCGKVLRKANSMLMPLKKRGSLDLHVLTSGELRLSWTRPDTSSTEEITTINRAGMMGSGVGECRPLGRRGPFKLRMMEEDASGRSFCLQFSNGSNVYFWIQEVSLEDGRALLDRLVQYTKKLPDLAKMTGLSEQQLHTLRKISLLPMAPASDPPTVWQPPMNRNPREDAYSRGWDLPNKSGKGGADGPTRNAVTTRGILGSSSRETVQTRLDNACKLTSSSPEHRQPMTASIPATATIPGGTGAAGHCRGEIGHSGGRAGSLRQPAVSTKGEASSLVSSCDVVNPHADDSSQAKGMQRGFLGTRGKAKVDRSMMQAAYRDSLKDLFQPPTPAKHRIEKNLQDVGNKGARREASEGDLGGKHERPRAARALCMNEKEECKPAEAKLTGLEQDMTTLGRTSALGGDSCLAPESGCKENDQGQSVATDDGATSNQVSDEETSSTGPSSMAGNPPQAGSIVNTSNIFDIF